MLDDCGYGTADPTHSHPPLHVHLVVVTDDAPRGRGFTQSRGRAVCLLSFRSKFSVKVLLREAITTVVIPGARAATVRYIFFI